MMPLGASIAGYTRQPMVAGREGVLYEPEGRRVNQTQEGWTGLELRDARLDFENSTGMLLPVDSWVVGFFSHVSGEGSLGGGTRLTDLHPNFLDELYASRLGIQAGAKIVAPVEKGQPAARVEAVYSLREIPQIDAETKQIRGDRAESLPETLAAPSGQTILVIRTIFESRAADDDKIFRFSPGAIRLKAGSRNYYPLGAVQQGSRLHWQRADDPMFSPAGKGADLLFVVDNADLQGQGTTAEQVKIADGVFLEVKRLSRIDLSGQTINATTTPLPPSDQIEVFRKRNVPPPANPR